MSDSEVPGHSPPGLDQARAQQLRYEILANEGSDLVCEFDEDGNYVYASPNHRNVLGWEPDRLRGTPALRRVHPEDRERGQAQLSAALRQESASVEVRIQHADGSWRWFECVGCGYSTQDGTVRVVLIARDVTARRDNERRLDQERELLQRMLDVQDRDRKLTAYEIHDGIVQDMSAARMYVESAAAQRERQPQQAAQNLQTASGTLERAIQEARRLINGLRPPALDVAGVLAAIELLVQDAQADGLDVQFQHPDQLQRMAPTLENAIYRISQEALNNVRQHSKSPTAQVSLRVEHERILLSIVDQGCGFDLRDESPRRFGLSGMRERARLLGGNTSIRSQPGQGTRVEAEFPFSVVADDPPSDEDE